MAESGDPKNVESDDTLLERYHLAVGRLVDRLGNELDEFVRGPISPQEYIRMLERLIILQWLTMGIPVTVEQARYCAGMDSPDSPDTSSKG
jgi:hypothetical protein